jgi:hypothetical protein
VHSRERRFESRHGHKLVIRQIALFYRSYDACFRAACTAAFFSAWLCSCVADQFASSCRGTKSRVGHQLRLKCLKI